MISIEKGVMLDKQTFLALHKKKLYGAYFTFTTDSGIVCHRFICNDSNFSEYSSYNATFFEELSVLKNFIKKTLKKPIPKAQIHIFRLNSLDCDFLIKIEKTNCKNILLRWGRVTLPIRYSKEVQRSNRLRKLGMHGSECV